VEGFQFVNAPEREERPQGQAGPAKQRKERRDKGRFLLTERDALALRWIGEQYAIRLDQLQQVLGRQAQRPTLVPGRVSAATALRVVERWRKAGYAGSDKFRLKEPAWVWLTRRGLSSLGLAYRYWEPGLATLDHVFWVNQVRLHVERRRGDEAVWVSERTLKLERGDQDSHLADAEVIIEDRTIAVEVELTPKKPSDIAAVVSELAGAYKTIWYFTSARARASVERAVAGLPEDLRRRFRSYDLQETL